MKNKLMRTTALVGSLMFIGTSIASAQTTVSGNLDLSFRAVQQKNSPVNSYQGFGKESQINISNKGKLNNGLDYAAGFSLEYDGNDNNGNGTTGWSTENTYIDFISGNTILTIGIDHIQNPDTHAHVNMTGVGYIGGDGIGSVTTATSGQNNKLASSIYPTGTLSQYQMYGIGLMQKTDVGTFSINFVPTSVWSTVDFGAANSLAVSSSNIGGLGGPDIGNGSSIALYEGTGEAQYEIGFTGNLGVKGLNVLAFYNSANPTNANQGGSDYSGKVLGGSYNFGQFTLGLDWRRQENAKTSTTNIVSTGKAVGVAYAVSPQLSIGATYGKADLGGTTISGYGDTEKTKIISAGYNLGPVVVNAQARSTTAIGGSSSVNGDAKDAIVKVSTKF